MRDIKIDDEMKSGNILQDEIMNKKYKKVLSPKNRNIQYSLHDSRVKEIKFHNKTLTLKVESIFEYVDGETHSYQGKICFKDCDLDLCDVLVFNKTLGKGYFNGKSFYLEELMGKVKDIIIEINNLLKEYNIKNAEAYMKIRRKNEKI